MKKDIPPKSIESSDSEKSKRIEEIQSELNKSKESRGQDTQKIRTMIDTLESLGAPKEKIDALRKAMSEKIEEIKEKESENKPRSKEQIEAEIAKAQVAINKNEEMMDKEREKLMQQGEKLGYTNEETEKLLKGEVVPVMPRKDLVIDNNPETEVETAPIVTTEDVVVENNPKTLKISRQEKKKAKNATIVKEKVPTQKKVNDGPENIKAPESPESEAEKIPTQVPPEAIKSFEQILSEAETKLKVELESSKFKNGIINGLSKWEKYGQGEEGIKGYIKRLTKTAINLSLIGVISSVSVHKLAENGIGTATALGGGVATALSRKMAMGLGFAGVMELAPEKVKKWLSIGMGVGSIALATALTGGGAGIAAGGSFLIGLGAQKFIKGKYTDEKIQEREEMAKAKFLEQIKTENRGLDEDSIRKTEVEYAKIFNRYKNQRIWGKLLDGAAKLTVGSIVSGIALEASGEARDYMKGHHISSTETANETADKTDHTNEISKEQQHHNDEAMLKAHDDKIAEIKHEAEVKQHEAEQVKIAMVHKGGSYERSFIHQIENDHKLAQELGYKGDVNDTKALHEFAGSKADIIARTHGIIDSNGNQLGISKADEVAPTIKVENGHVIIEDKTIDGKIIATHNEGDKFGEHLNKYEYNIKEHEIKTENNTTPQENSDQYKLPPQVNPITGEPVVIEKPQNEVIPITKLENLKFENPLHTISIGKDDLEFKYGDDRHIIGIVHTTHGPAPVTDYHITNETELAKLDSQEAFQTRVEIDDLGLKTEFLKHIPSNTYEHQFLIEDIIKSQQVIINDHGNVINVEKLENLYQHSNLINTPQQETINPGTLSPEMETALKETYTKNIEHLFPDKKIDSWNEIKNSYSVEKLMHVNKEGGLADVYKPLASHITKLEEISGLKPVLETAITKAESIPHFIIRTEEAIAKMGKLDEIKL